MQSCKKYFSFWETGKFFCGDESIVYNRIYTICNRSAALSVERYIDKVTESGFQAIKVSGDVEK